MNPGLYNDVIILGSKREKNYKTFFFLQLHFSRADRFAAAVVFIHQSTPLQKVEYF